MDGMKGGCSPQEEKQAFQDLLKSVRSLMAKKGMAEGGEQEDEFLDPESLLAKEGGEEMGEGAEEVAEAATSMGEDEAMGEAAGEDAFDQAEVASFFGKTAGSDRKPLKTARFGMSNDSSGMKPGRKKV